MPKKKRRRGSQRHARPTLPYSPIPASFLGRQVLDERALEERMRADAIRLFPALAADAGYLDNDGRPSSSTLVALFSCGCVACFLDPVYLVNGRLSHEGKDALALDQGSWVLTRDEEHDLTVLDHAPTLEAAMRKARGLGGTRFVDFVDWWFGEVCHLTTDKEPREAPPRSDGSTAAA